MSDDHYVNAASLAQSALAASTGGPPVTAEVAAVGVLIARGPDAGPFLHGQLAAEIQGLSAGRSTRSLLLNHRGHALAEAVVARDAAEWLVIVEDGMVDWVRATLADHIVFDDVTLSAVPGAATVTLQGSEALAVLLAAVPGAATLAASPSGDATGSGPGAAFFRGVHAATGLAVVVYRRNRSGAGGYDLTLLAAGPAGGSVAGAHDGEVPAGRDATHGPRATVEAATELLLQELVAAGALRVTGAAIDAARVAAGLTTAGRDGGDGVLPQEADLTGGLSYRKGCYLGQEVMARIEARGNLKRGLATLELTEPAQAANGPAATATPPEGTAEVGAAATGRDIELGGRKVGVLGTVARMPDGRLLALAVLRRDVDPDAVLSVGGIAARLTHPPPL